MIVLMSQRGVMFYASCERDGEREICHVSYGKDHAEKLFAVRACWSDNEFVWEIESNQ
jgi:hypothetical protein